MDGLTLCLTCVHKDKLKVITKGELQKLECAPSGADRKHQIKQCSYFDLDTNKFQEHLHYLSECYKQRKN